jgi:ATPases involved in chromosome partitioning
VVETPESPAAEAFRNLRAALSLLGPEAERKVSLFTSAVPNEGKSFTSANYSLALAQQGYRVLLIDGDLRRPNVHKIFRFPNARNNSDEDSRRE